MIDPQNHPYLPISQENSAVSTDRKSSQHKGMDKDDNYYNEINQNGETVAKYHVWHHISIYPPQKIGEGWKKFDLEDNVVASGTTK